MRKNTQFCLNNTCFLLDIPLYKYDYLPVYLKMCSIFSLLLYVPFFIGVRYDTMIDALGFVAVIIWTVIQIRSFLDRNIIPT